MWNLTNSASLPCLTNAATAVQRGGVAACAIDGICSGALPQPTACSSGSSITLCLD
jgi:hypothetical protein